MRQILFPSLIAWAVEIRVLLAAVEIRVLLVGVRSLSLAARQVNSLNRKRRANLSLQRTVEEFLVGIIAIAPPLNFTLACKAFGLGWYSKIIG
ncbi:hypothetical protein ACKFKF_30340 [Phormidesmis sp. 146-12]